MRRIRTVAAYVLGAAAIAACDPSLPVPPPSGTVTSPATVSSASNAPTFGGSASAGATSTAPSRPSVSANADLHIVGGFNTVDIIAGDLGNDLVRAVAPAGSGGTPVVSISGTVVTVTERDSPNKNGQKAMQITVSAKAAWSISLDGGVNVAVIDLSGAGVRGLNITQGVTSLQVTLSPPTGTVALAVSAGVSQLRAHLRGAAPVRTTLSAGAGAVTIDGNTHSGVAGGSTFATPGWDTAPDRVDIACSAGVGSLVVDRV